MEFKMVIEMDNDAFETGDNVELSRILRKVADDVVLQHGKILDKIRDYNGNTVGKYWVKD